MKWLRMKKSVSHETKLTWSEASAPEVEDKLPSIRKWNINTIIRAIRTENTTVPGAYNWQRLNKCS